MLIAFARDALHVDLRRRAVAVTQRLLYLVERARLVCDHPPEGVPQLVDVNLFDPGFCGVQLQVVREGVRRERRVWPPGRASSGGEIRETRRTLSTDAARGGQAPALVYESESPRGGYPTHKFSELSSDLSGV